MATEDGIRAKDILPHKTSFSAGDGFYGDGESSFYMEADTLLELTAQNALADNLTPAFDPTRTSENPYLVGDSVVYEGKTYVVDVEHYGPWDSAHFTRTSGEALFAKKSFGTDNIKNLPTAITSFRTGDVIPVDGPDGTAKMSKDDLLQLTAQNALVDNMAPAFDPNKPNGFDGFAYHKNEKVVYEGVVYLFVSNKTTGVWDSNYVRRVSICDLLQNFKTAGQNIDYAITDKNGFALSLFRDGHIQTKHFDSSNLSKEIPVADFVISDENLNAIVIFKDGHIMTKNFDSSRIATELTIDFTGKKFCFIGDSLTDETSYTSYVSLLAERTHATCVNLGVAGTSIGGRAGAPYGTFKDRATAANLQGADLVCVFGGTNDFDRATYPIGPLFKEIENNPWQYSTGIKYGIPDNTGAFGGAVHELILTIRQNCPHTPIMFITPLNRGEYSDNRPTSQEQNAHGDTMQDFRNAIETICNFYAIPVFKAHQIPQFDFTDPSTASVYSRDNLHLNLLGQTILERQLEKWIYFNINLQQGE